MRRLLLGVCVACLWASFAQAEIDCDGADDFLASTGALDLFVTAPAFTMMLWFDPTTPDPSAACDTAASQLVLGDHGNWMGILRPTATTTCARAWDTVALLPRMVSGTSGSGMSHLAMRLGGGTLTYFLNGVSVGTASLGTLGNTDNPLRLCFGGEFQPTPGRLADVRTYQVALADGEIAAIAGGRRTRLLGTRPSGQWTLESCPPGSSGQGVAFRTTGSATGAAALLTGDDGANNTGLTCQASRVLSQWGGVQ